jgi:hypothetical protein
VGVLVLNVNIVTLNVICPPSKVSRNLRPSSGVLPTPPNSQLWKPKTTLNEATTSTGASQSLPKAQKPKNELKSTSGALLTPPNLQTHMPSCSRIVYPDMCLQWSNNSCTYNAAFLILKQIWLEEGHLFDAYTHLKIISQLFQSQITGNESQESICNVFQNLYNIS